MDKFLIIGVFTILIGCGKKNDAQSPPPTVHQSVQPVEQQKHVEITRDIPVLCYHNFSEDKNEGLTLSRKRFEEHMSVLADRGYQTILPGELFDYLTAGKALPAKPIVITFDDTRAGQYSIARPILEQHGFKGVFFIMTVSVGKAGYMSVEELKMLSNKGNAVEAHTYDHPLMKNIKENDWEKQLGKPKAFLEKMVNKPVYYFAYPNGLYTEKSITQLKNFGYKAAFQLNDKKSKTSPLYTIRRIMVQADWQAGTLLNHISSSFH